MKKMMLVLLSLFTLNSFALAPKAKVELKTLKVEKNLKKEDLSKVIESEIEVFNPSDKETTVRLVLLHPQFAKPKQTDISLEPYILSKDKTYTIQPNTSTKIKIGVKLPETFLGSKYVYYGFDVVESDKKFKTLEFQMIMYGQMTLSSVDGLERKATITTDYQKNDKQIIIKSKLLNIGNTYIRRIEMYCLLQDENNKFIGKFPMTAEEGSYLFQTNEREYSAMINKKLKGKIKMTIIVNNNDGNFNLIDKKEITL